MHHFDAEVGVRPHFEKKIQMVSLRSRKNAL
jgi:hypothetical protein